MAIPAVRAKHLPIMLLVILMSGCAERHCQYATSAVRYIEACQGTPSCVLNAKDLKRLDYNRSKTRRLCEA